MPGAKKMPVDEKHVFKTQPPDELSDPNLTPLPTHPGTKYFARTLAAMFRLLTVFRAVTVLNS